MARRSPGICAEASEIVADTLKVPTDLVTRVKERRESTLDTFAEDIALILSVERAQLEILAEQFEARHETAAVMTGYSLGEIAALIVGGSLPFADTLVPLVSLAGDCAALAEDTTMGGLLTRSRVAAGRDRAALFGIELRRSRRDRGVVVSVAQHGVGDGTRRHARSTQGARDRVTRQERQRAQERSPLAPVAHADLVATGGAESCRGHDAHDGRWLARAATAGPLAGHWQGELHRSQLP